MLGANVPTKELHRELKKKGWQLTRTAGDHDVFTHPEAKHHLSIPRHRQLKAPLVMKVLKAMKVDETRIMSFSEFISEADNERFNQIKGAFEKMQQRKEFYGKRPQDIRGEPDEIGDTWDDYKKHMRVHGDIPMKKSQPQPEDDKAVPLDVDKHQDLNVIGKRSSKKIMEAEYQGRSVPLNKPMAGDVKKSKVFVRNAEGNVVKVNFGDKNMTIKKNIPARRRSFRARHNCDDPGPKTKARYWSCKAW